MSDSAVVSLILGTFAVVIGFFSWLLVLSFKLGSSQAKLDSVAEAVRKMETTTERIFERLDTLAAAVPHHCDQMPVIATIQADVKAHSATLDEHGHRMDRIQTSLLDKEQRVHGATA